MCSLFYLSKIGKPKHSSNCNEIFFLCEKWLCEVWKKLSEKLEGLKSELPSYVAKYDCMSDKLDKLTMVEESPP